MKKISEISSWVRVSKENLVWKNTNNGSNLYVDYNSANNKWEVFGDNSTIDSAESRKVAKRKALDYMDSTDRPSGML